MKKQTTKQLYKNLFTKKYKSDVYNFLDDIKTIDNIFWGACRDFSKDILELKKNWCWLSFRVDDFACNVEDYMISKIHKWQIKGSLSKQLYSFEKTIYWLFDRYVNTLKNKFDSRYKDSIPMSYLQNLENILIADIETEIEIEIESEIESEFLKLCHGEKILILKKCWKENLLDNDFSIEDMRYLCEKYQMPPPKTFLLA